MLPDGALPAWQHDLLLRIVRAPEFELALRIAGESRRGRSAYDLFERLDRRHYRLADDALAPVVLASELHTVPRIDAAALGQGDVDVILRFADSPAADQLAAAARFGVWSPRLDDPEGRPGTAAFWDVHDARDVGRTEVEFRLPGEAARVLYSSTSRVQRPSVYRELNLNCWKAAEAIFCRLVTLERVGLDGLRRTLGPELPPEWSRGRVPPAAAVARQLARTVTLELRRSVPPATRWAVAYRRHGEPSYTLVRAPEGEFHADPFVLARDGRHHVFFERFRDQTGRGEIACLELTDAGAAEPVTVLERPYHLSFPFVFEWEGEAYVLPETAANRTVELYRAADYPLRWEPAHVLMRDVAALDTTLLRHDGRFWLFTVVNPRGLRAHSELYLYWSATLDGEWTPHPLNPVVSDVRSARAAGRVFERDGALIRPGQDSGPRYGYAVTFNRIEVLTEDDYRETPAWRMEPDVLPGALGTHAYDSDGVYEVVDGLFDAGLRATTR